MAETLPAALLGALTSQALCRRRDRVLVAVSGGADSVALLRALHELASSAFPLQLRVAHLDHQLRPEAPADAEFVRELAAQLRLPVAISREDVAARCRQEGWSIEDGARRVRYQWLRETAQRASSHAIAVAHTADDQAETVLMRLMRGAGLGGVAAMSGARSIDGIPLIRPMLGLWRSEVVQYLGALRQPHREDASNDDRRFLRNRVRHELLPLLERSFNPNIRRALVQLANRSRDDYDYLQRSADRYWKRVAKVSRAGSVVMVIEPLRRQPVALQRQLVRRAIREVRGDLTAVEFRHWEAVEALMQSAGEGGIVDLPGGVRVIRDRGRLCCERSERSGLADP